MRQYNPAPEKTVTRLDNGFLDIDGSIYNEQGVFIAKRKPEEKPNLTLPDESKMSIGNFTSNGFIDRKPLDSMSEIDVSKQEQVQVTPNPNQGQNVPENAHLQGQTITQDSGYDGMSFSDAFKSARQQGLKEFNWRVGQNQANPSGRYTTELAPNAPVSVQPQQQGQQQQTRVVTPEANVNENEDQLKTGVARDRQGFITDSLSKIQAFADTLSLIDSVVQRNPNIDLDKLETEEGLQEFISSLTPEERKIFQQQEQQFAREQEMRDRIANTDVTGNAIRNVTGAAATVAAMSLAVRMYKTYKKNQHPINYTIPRNYRRTNVNIEPEVAAKVTPNTTVPGQTSAAPSNVSAPEVITSQQAVQSRASLANKVGELRAEIPDFPGTIRTAPKITDLDIRDIKPMDAGTPPDLYGKIKNPTVTPVARPRSMPTRMWNTARTTVKSVDALMEVPGAISRIQLDRQMKNASNENLQKLHMDALQKFARSLYNTDKPWEESSMEQAIQQIEMEMSKRGIDFEPANTSEWKENVNQMTHSRRRLEI